MYWFNTVKYKINIIEIKILQQNTENIKKKKITCPISFNNVDKTMKNPDEKPIKIYPSPCLKIYK